MAVTEPATELEPDFSSPKASPTPWAEAMENLERAPVYWLSTVRPNGHPHVTPLVAVWLDGPLYFCTGESERKTKNLAHNARCVITTGCNALDTGLDLVIEGNAVRVTDVETLQRLTGCFAAKYAPPFQFDFAADENGNRPLVFKVAPTTAFGFGKGELFSQTRWRF